MRVNLSGVETGKFDPIPAGRYHLKLTDGEWKEVGEQAKNAGADMYNAEFTVQDGEFQGRKVWTNFLFIDSSVWRIKQFLEATGKFTDDQLAGELDVDFQDLMGSDVVANIKVRPETDQYDASNDIRKFLPADSPVSSGSGGGSLLP